MEPWKLQPAHDAGLDIGQQIASARREPGLVGTLSLMGSAAVLGLYLKIWHRLEIVGADRLPATGPFVLAANHASHLDAISLAAAVPWRLRDRVCPIAAGDTFFSSPLTGLCSVFLLNALPLWRQRARLHALDELRQRLGWDESVYILFPEGTRSRTGAMAPFKSGLGMLVAGTPVPVVPCRIDGAFGAWPAGKWIARPRKIRLTVGRPLSFREHENTREGWEAIAAHVEAAVRALGGAPT